MTSALTKIAGLQLDSSTLYEIRRGDFKQSSCSQSQNVVALWFLSCSAFMPCPLRGAVLPKVRIQPTQTNAICTISKPLNTFVQNQEPHLCARRRPSSWQWYEPLPKQGETNIGATSSFAFLALRIYRGMGSADLSKQSKDCLWQKTRTKIQHRVRAIFIRRFQTRGRHADLCFFVYRPYIVPRHRKCSVMTAKGVL